MEYCSIEKIDSHIKEAINNAYSCMQNSGYNIAHRRDCAKCVILLSFCFLSYMYKPKIEAMKQGAIDFLCNNF